VLAVVVLGATLLSACHGPVHAKLVIGGLDSVVAFTVEADGSHLWYAERFSGEIRRRDLSSSEDVLVWTVSNVLTSGEQGLLGVALHPDYPSSPFVYAFASRQVGGAARNQILKITISGGVGVSQQAIVNDLNIGSFHNGGRIQFGPDANLYAVIGEHGNPANSQVVDGNTNLAGKVLRITPDGAVPGGNPFPGSFVWAHGIRNSFGFDFDPANGRLWLTDNGPACNDEVDRIVKGGNYAWGPGATCSSPPAAPQNTNQSGPSPQRGPQHFYANADGITGAAFCSLCGVDLHGKLIISFVNNGIVHSLTLNGSRTTIVDDDIVYDHPGPVISIESNPGGPIYFTDGSAIYRLSLAG
jgi:glucose/arabinose dehydrogenase